jgi:hypothetical protein
MSEARTWNGTDLLLKGGKKEILGLSIHIKAYLTAIMRRTLLTFVDPSVSSEASLSV